MRPAEASTAIKSAQRTLLDPDLEAATRERQYKLMAEANKASEENLAAFYRDTRQQTACFVRGELYFTW